VTGDTGSQRFETKPSAIQTGSRGAREARASHSRTGPLGPFSASSISAISRQAWAVGCAPSTKSGVKAARAFLKSRAESAVLRQYVAAFRRIGRKGGKFFDPRDALTVRLVLQRFEIEIAQLRMRIFGPDRLHEFERPFLIAVAQQRPHRYGRRRREAGTALARLSRKMQRVMRMCALFLKRHRGLDYGSEPLRRLDVDRF